jgi:hypothetical protein
MSQGCQAPVCSHGIDECARCKSVVVGPSEAEASSAVIPDAFRSVASTSRAYLQPCNYSRYALKIIHVAGVVAVCLLVKIAEQVVRPDTYIGSAE